MRVIAALSEQVAVFRISTSLNFSSFPAAAGAVSIRAGNEWEDEGRVLVYKYIELLEGECGHDF